MASRKRFNYTRMRPEISDVPLEHLSKSNSLVSELHNGVSFEPSALWTDDNAEDGELASRHGSVSSLRSHHGVQKILIKQSFLPLSTREIGLHLFSIAFSLAIIGLCTTDIYFKDVDTPNVNAMLNAFQFVAALHTVIVGLSVGAIAVNHLLYELCQKGGLPLGYLVMPFQLSAVTIPFRTRFWVATFSRTNTARKLLFGVGVVAAVALQVLIGPSAAILIVPQLEFWEYANPFATTNGLAYFNQSHEYMWPVDIQGSDVPLGCNYTDILMPSYCPYANIAQIRRWGEDWRDQFSSSNISSLGSSNQLRYVSASVENETDMGYSAASTAMEHITRDFGDLWTYATRHRGKIPFGNFARPRLALRATDQTRPVLRPLIQTQCDLPFNLTSLSEAEYSVTFASNLLYDTPGRTFNNITATIDVSPFKNASVVARFVGLPDDAGRPALGALFGMNFSHPSQAFDQNFQREFGSGLIACRIVAHWIPTNMTSEPKTDNVVLVDRPYPGLLVQDPDMMSQAVPINLDITYLDRVNLYIQDKEINVLEYILRGVAEIGSGFQYYSGMWRKRWPWTLATVTSMLLSDGLSRLRVDSRMMMLCAGCLDDKDAQMGKNTIQDLYAQNNPENTHLTNFTAREIQRRVADSPDLYMPVEWHLQRFGYGWGLSNMTKWLSMITIIAQLIIVVAHLIVVTMRKVRFEAWESFPEFLSLANRSPAVKSLHNLGIGIVDNSIYGHDVAIRATSSKDGKNTHAILTTSVDLPKVEMNREYS